MVTNNKYYKTIYENVTGLTVTGHHKNTYYMRKVCESYGVEYDEFKPLAKYVRDYAVALDIDVGSKHKPLRTLLHMIAEELYSGSLEHDTVNYYLKIISENIIPPTPSAYNTTWTLNGVESGESAILSHANSQNAVFVFTVEDINGHPVSNCQIPIEVDGEAVSPIPTTDTDGVASFTYASQGVGDVSVSADIMIDGSLVSKTYEVSDRIAYHADEITITSAMYPFDDSTFDLSSPVEITFDYNSNIGSSVLITNGFRFGVISETGYKEFGYSQSGWHNQKHINIGSGYNSYKYIINGNTVEYYLNGELQTTQTYSQISTITDWKLQCGKWSGTSCSIKNISIKPL